MFCPNCGKQLDDNAAGFCPECGAPLNQQQQQNTAPNAQPNPAPAGAYLNGQDKLVMALICVFLGGLGIHNFIMGETKKGIFKIVMSLCCGIGEILALIDFVRILSGSYVVDTEKLM